MEVVNASGLPHSPDPPFLPVMEEASVGEFGVAVTVAVLNIGSALIISVDDSSNEDGDVEDCRCKMSEDKLSANAAFL